MWNPVEFSFKILQPLVVFFSFLVLPWQYLSQLKSRHIMHCWYWGSDIPSLKFSLLFVVVFLHGWHHGALLVCPWPSSRTLLPQQRNDSRKEKLFARKPIREMLTNILFPAKLFRDKEKHLGLFDRNILTPVAIRSDFFSLSRTLQESLAIIS